MSFHPLFAAVFSRKSSWSQALSIVTTLEATNVANC